MSDDALFSEHWYRVKDLKPRLARDVAVARHLYRDVPWYVLYRASTGAYHRVRAAEFEIIDSLDGTATVDELWHKALASRGAEAPSQPEMLTLLAQLHEADLLTVDRRLNVDMLFARGARAAQADRRQRFLNPLYLRFRAIDPDVLLGALAPLGRILFGRAGAALWICLISLALFQIAPMWGELRHQFTGFDFFSPLNGFLFFLAFPLIKLLHEIAHGLAVKRLGGEVHEMGIALLVLLPVPYVDASAAAAFPSKTDRMLVGAAGILMELGIAAVAALVWSASEPGRLHDVAFMVMLIGGLSTLIFNGNPLLKFDGYYVLSDALEILNLADRSKRYLLGRLQRRLFGIEDEQEQPQDDWEAFWLALYALAAGAYRIVLMLTIAYLLAGRYFFFGVALAIWIVVMQILVPAGRLLAFMLRQRGSRRLRTLAVTTTIVTCSAALLALLPLPLNTVAQGVVWLPEHAIVRTGSRCEVVEVVVRPGAAVAPGDTLFRCDDAALEAELAGLQAQLDERRAERAGLDTVDRAQRLILDNEIATLERRQSAAREQYDKRIVTAEAAGRFTVAGTLALAGRHFAQGDIAAYIVPADTRAIRVALTQAPIGRIGAGVERVEVRFTEQRTDNRSYDTSITRQTPKAGVDLPSVALTTRGGGDVLADPADPKGLTAAEPVFDLQLAWPEDAPHLQVGGHVHVKFVHPPAPLAQRLITDLRRAFLRQVSA